MSQPQVIVVGAGPAGTTTATLLAKQGISVRVLEKAIFPRWHIGESLLPADLPIFERLGFVPDKSNYVYKVGAEFINEETGDFALYRFDDALEGTPPHAWQVERARFDTDLATIAQDNGVEVQFGVKVRHIEISDERVSVEAVTDGGVTTHHARYLVDATGQDAFLGRRKRTIEPIKGFGVVAVATVFEDLDPAVTAELEEQGNIKILIREDGWGWVIPLRGRVSIGMVTQERGLGQAMLDEGIDESPLLTRLTQGATRGQTWVLRNFAYLNRDAYGRRWGCVGDAAAFLDPVFSSGVSLAMFGGQGVADVVGPAILEGQEDQPDLLEPHAIRMR
ncbi:MAG: NAD(P)/FAD-dependent oxidoreductase, partial [Myxococcota bacterium]